MELHDFVKQTLESILRGVQEAREGYGGDDICPDYDSIDPKSVLYIASGDRIVVPVSFDVAVEATDATGKEGGGQIRVMSIGAGAKLENRTTETKTTKLSFVVPISVPRAANKKPFVDPWIPRSVV